MSLITIVRRNLRKAAARIRATKIRMLEQDIDWARASSDAHIRGLEMQLAELRRAQWAELTAQDIARDMDKRGKRFA